MAHPESRLKKQPPLLPATAHGDPASLRAALAEGGPALLDLILAQDLGALWHYSLQTYGLLESLPPETIAALRQARISAAVGYLAQRAALDHLDRLFEAEGIPYVAMKGTHIRECIYPDPTLRPASDIDLLIAGTDRRRAARTLLDAGYTVRLEPVNVSHEATFNQGAVDIDLHWHILRPGRTRLELTTELLARKQRTNGLWGLSDNDILFLMLTHPAITKYVCSPNMGLLRVADFLLWIHRRQIDWPAVLQLLERAGLKTAAWAMLSWFRMLAPPDAAITIDRWLSTVRPGRLRAAYLHQWLAHDLPSRWLDRPFLIQFGFTLLLHDRPADMFHAIRGWQQARTRRQSDARHLLGEDYRHPDQPPL